MTGKDLEIELAMSGDRDKEIYIETGDYMSGIPVLKKVLGFKEAWAYPIQKNRALLNREYEGGVKTIVLLEVEE